MQGLTSNIPAMRQIADMRLRGADLVEIGEAIGYSAPTVCRALKSPAIKPLLVAQYKRLAKLAPKAVATYEQYLGKEGEPLPSFEDKADKEFQFRAADRITSITGLAPGVQPNTYIQQIFAPTTITLAAPIARALGITYTSPDRSQDTEDVLDADCTDLDIIDQSTDGDLP